MRKIIVLFILSLFFTAGVKAQRPDSVLFLFPDFREATVYYINGTRSTEQVNFNFFLEKLFFIDKQNNQVKVVGNIDTVSWIEINGRMFYIDNRYIVERISNDPYMEVRYVKKIRDGGAKGAYGGNTETSAATGYLPTHDYWRYIQEIDLSRLIIGPMNQEYIIERSGNIKEFRTWSQFYKIYPKHKGALKDYIKENMPDFSSTADVLQVYRYAESLK